MTHLSKDKPVIILKPLIVMGSLSYVLIDQKPITVFFATS